MSVTKSESPTPGGVSVQDSGFVIVPLSPEVDRMPILMRYARGVDLVRKPINGSLDKGTLAGREYEHECFANRVSLLSSDQYALGPGIVDEAFSMLRIGIPDEIVLDIGPENLTLARMAEYRIGRRHSVSRVKDFSRLTRYLRKHPEAFSNNGGRIIGALPFRSMIVPPNRDIIVEFVSPREYSPLEEVRVKGFPFRMRYSTIPLPPAST